MLEDALQGIGFSQKEAKVYLANLELGMAKPSQISEKSGLNRVTAYEVLKKLKEKEAVLEIIKNKVKYYSPVNPETVVAKAKSRLIIAEKSLPELLSINNLNTKKPRILFFEGLEGIKKIYADTLTSKTEIVNITNAKNIYQLIPDFDASYVSQRIKRGINVRAVALGDPSGLRAKKEGSTVLREVRLVPPYQYAFTNEIMIYDQKVAIVSLLEKVGVIIESADIAKTQREIFKMAWEYAGRFG